MVLPREAILQARKYLAITLFGIITLASFLVLWASKMKLELSIKCVIFGYFVLFATRMGQSLSESLDERTSGYWDTAIAVLFEFCWAFMYYFVSQMQIVKTLLMDREIDNDESVTNILKSIKSKGERIRN